MLLTGESTQYTTIFFENILPAVIAAIVALLGVLVQLFIGMRSNKVVMKSILESKKIESRIQFYRPLSMKLNEIKVFFETRSDFEFNSDKYNDVNYKSDLCELQKIYSAICNWYIINISNMYPEQEKLDNNIMNFYKHMNIILQVEKSNPKSWKNLQRYKKKDILDLIEDINNKINKLLYKKVNIPVKELWMKKKGT